MSLMTEGLKKMLGEPEGKEKYQAKFLYLTDNDETFFALQGNADLVPTSGLDNLVTLQYEAEDTYVLSNHQCDMEAFETYKAQSCSGQTDSECLSNHLAEVQAKRRETAAVSLLPWGGVARLLKKADKASATDTAALDAGAKPRQFDDAKAPFSTPSGKDASIPPNATNNAPNRTPVETLNGALVRLADSPNYSTAAEVQLPSDAYPGVSRRRHNQISNQALHETFEANPSYAAEMENLYPGIVDGVRPGPRGAYPRNAPTPDVTWHHGTKPGQMQLVPFNQRTAPGPVQGSLHPGQNSGGGFADWGTE